MFVYNMTIEMKDELAKLAAETGQTMDYFEELTSTNDQAQDPRYKDGDVIMAGRQTAGRGQRGNRWSSAEGMNLTFSIVAYPEWLEARDQFYISKVVALGVTDALEKLGVTSRIKWPNDIYIKDRKVAGILIENDLMDQYVSRSVVGIGLNVNQRKFDLALPNPVSLAQACGKDLDRGEVFRVLYNCLAGRYSQLSGEDFNGLDVDYIKRLYRFGKKHVFADGQTHGRFAGTICGVRPTGELEVLRADGKIYAYLFKEIEYVI